MTLKTGMEGHVFVAPVSPQAHMAMLCYKNGSLTREVGFFTHTHTHTHTTLTE